MRNLKLTIAYNGHEFFGWQKQDGLRTVQGTLEQAFFNLTGENVDIEGSGRTDKGVHALGQVASVKTENIMPIKNFKRALNNILPPDVRILKVENAPEDFHARFSAKKKTYCYVVKVGGDADAIDFSTLAHFDYDVDIDKMKQATKLLIGKHDFRGFCSSGTQVNDFVREIFDIKISKKGRVYTFDVCGNGFLYNMVRIIVGTLLDVGRGKIEKENIKKALESGERKYAGTTMPPEGLFLKKVEYLKK